MCEYDPSPTLALQHCNKSFSLREEKTAKAFLVPSFNLFEFQQCLRSIFILQDLIVLFNPHLHGSGTTGYSILCMVFYSKVLK